MHEELTRLSLLRRLRFLSMSTLTLRSGASKFVESPLELSSASPRK